MNAPRIGELFAGYGGLGMGVQQVYGGEVVWVSEFDKGPSKILAHRFPDVPNHGDITAIDWSQVEPVDILTGGSPCQDLSHAGRRAGMTEGTRSNLWVAMREAIAQLRPALVVWENVGGALSAEADSGVEPCAGCVGDGTGVHLRALGRVLGDLASLGYDASWHSLRAADVGAPHGRLRVFVVASHAHDSGRGQRRRPIPASPQHGPAQHASQDPLTLLPTPAVNDMGEGKTVDRWDEWTATMQAKHGNGNGHGKSLAIEAQRLLPTPTTRDLAASGGSTPSDVTLTDAVVRTDLGSKENPRHAHSPEGRSGQVLRDLRDADVPQEVRDATRGPNALPLAEDLLAVVREHASRGDEGRASLASQEAQGADLPGLRRDGGLACSPRGQESGEQRSVEPDDVVRKLSSEVALAGGSPGVDWGPYTAAIRRWEVILGRPAPMPTQLSAKGNPQLSPRFVEFLMGLPDGWVTDVPGITRNEALKALGNGVVPQQAAEALRVMAGWAVAA